jgi:hypothetical protein
MNQFDGELAALRHQREMESLGDSPISGQVLDGAIELAQKFGLPSFVGNLFKKALSQGKLPVEKMIENLESAAFEEVRRIWEQLDGQAKRQQEFESRLESKEAQSAYLSAFLHGLRTSDPEKHSRLARLTINCIFENDMKPESLDGMMRAAVELKEADIILLGKIYDVLAKLLDYNQTLSSEWCQQIAAGWSNNFTFLDSPSQRGSRSSLARLQSAGLIQEVRTMMTPTGELRTHPFGLLPEGKKFYERLQEVVVHK